MCNISNVIDMAFGKFINYDLGKSGFAFLSATIGLSETAVEEVHLCGGLVVAIRDWACNGQV